MSDPSANVTLQSNPTSIQLGQVSSNYKSQHQQQYTSQQQIKLTVPAFAGFMDSLASYLKFDVEISGTSKTFLNQRADAHSLIQTVSIYDGTMTTLIERIENYNLLVAQMNHFKENFSVKNKRVLLEGSTDITNQDVCPFYENYVGEESVEIPLVKKKVSVCIQLQTGVFTSPNIIPIGQLAGLTVVIDLASDTEALQSYAVGTSTKLENVVEVDGDATDTISVRSTDATSPIDITSCGVAVGDVLLIEPAGGGDTVTVTVVALTASEESGFVDITFTPAIDFSTTALPPNSAFSLDETNLDETVKFTISNVELSIKDVTPPQQYVDSVMKAMNSQMGYNFDINSFDVYRNNITFSELATNMFIPSINQRAIAIFSLPMDNTTSTQLSIDSFKPLFENKTKDYIFNIHGKQQPNQRVELELLRNNRTDPLYLFEVSKALESSGVDIRNVRDSWDNFMIARSVGRRNSTSDLSDGSLNLQVRYISGSAKNKLFHHFVCHSRRVILQLGEPPMVIV